MTINFDLRIHLSRKYRLVLDSTFYLKVICFFKRAAKALIIDTFCLIISISIYVPSINTGACGLNSINTSNRIQIIDFSDQKNQVTLHFSQRFGSEYELNYRSFLKYLKKSRRRSTHMEIKHMILTKVRFLLSL